MTIAQILAMIVNLCVGSVNTQVCHTNIKSCFLKSQKAEASRVAECSKPHVFYSECLKAGGGLPKSDEALLLQCM